MIPSRFQISDELKRQESLSHYLLRWMLDNQAKTRHTSMACMSRSTNHTKGTVSSRTMTFHNMLNNQMISRFGTRKDGNFYINWFHKDIPSDILERAPSDTLDQLKRLKSGLKPNQSVDAIGCKVTKLPRKTTVKEEQKPKIHIPVEDKQVDKETIASAPVEVTKDNNGNLSIAININLNLK